MSKLRRPFSYATSGNYPGSIGTTSWSGLARRYSPTDTELADGDTPDTPIGVEKANYFLAVQGDALTVQNHAALTTWKQSVFTAAGSLALRFLLPVPSGATIAAANVRPRTFIVSGNAGGGNQGAKASVDLQSFEIALGVGAFTPYLAVAADDSGVIFGGIASGAYKSSADGGQTYSTFAPGVPVVHAVYYTGASYIVMAGGGAVTSATALGGAWSAAIFLPTTIHTQQIAGNRVNGSTATTLVALILDSVANHYIVYASSNNGASWTLAHDFGAVTAANIVYSEAWGLYVVLTSTGELWTSPDSTTWTKQKTAAVLAIDTGFAKSCALGDAIVAVVNRVSGTAFNNDLGIAYTFDLGATWYETYFGDMSATSQIHTVIAANGRLYACDDTKIYISGVLESPAAPHYLGV